MMMMMIIWNGSSYNKWIQQTSAKNSKTRHDWVEKVINWELCNRLKFYQGTKWYMHKPEWNPENKTYKIL